MKKDEVVVMKINHPAQMRNLKNVYGYVATVAPAWNEASYDLWRAIDPHARMSMQLINYCKHPHDRSWLRMVKNTWSSCVEYANISMKTADDHESSSPICLNRIRKSLIDLTGADPVQNWYMAGFRVCEESGLEIMLGHIRDSRQSEAPHNAYATVNLVYPERDLHLRFKACDPHAVKVGKPLFYDVHITKPSDEVERGDYKSIRVREYYPSKSRKPGRYDVCDLQFAKAESSQIPIVHYTDVKAYPVIG